MSKDIITVMPDYQPAYAVYVNHKITVARLYLIKNKWRVFNWQKLEIPGLSEYDDIEQATQAVIDLIEKYPRIAQPDKKGNLPTLDQVFLKG